MTAIAAPPHFVPLPQRPRLRWFRARGEIVWLFLIALAVRAAAAWASPSILNDSVSMLRSADRFRTDGLAAAMTGPDHPLGPWLVTLLPSGIDPEAGATWICVLAGAFAVWPLHVLARRACGRHAATAAAIVYIALPKAIGVSSVPLTSAVFLPLFLSGLSLAVAAGLPSMPRRHLGHGAARWRLRLRIATKRRTGWRRIVRLVSAGLLCGLAYLCRPEGLVAAAGALAAVVTLARRGRRLWSAAIVAVTFLAVAAPYAVGLSRQAGHLVVSPKKDVVLFLGASAAPNESKDARAAAQDLASGLEGALTAPILLLVLVGSFLPTRWRHRHSIGPRTLLLLLAAGLFGLVMRLQMGWGYGGARHLLPGALLLLPFAGEGFLFLGVFISRVIARRRLAIVLASFVAVPLVVKSLLRPEGDEQAHARRLGETIAAASPDGSQVAIASFREPLVAYYADRGLRKRGGGARDVPLWGRFHALLDQADTLAARSELAAKLRSEGAQWLVVDLFRGAQGDDPSPGFGLAKRLADDGAIALPAVSTGSPLTAFPVR